MGVMTQWKYSARMPDHIIVWSERLGMPIGMLSPDPIVQDFANHVVAREQPYIYRLVYLGIDSLRYQLEKDGLNRK
jgi:hypothetical protein